MERLLFVKKVDKSLLKAGLTIPVEQHTAMLSALEAVLGRGSHFTVDIYVGGIAYPAMFTHVNLTIADREVYQIRYAEGSDICKKINELFGEGTGVKEINILTDGHRHLIFERA